MTPADRALARAVELLGNVNVEVRSAVVVEDSETDRLYRRIMAVRVVVFAMGAAMALSWGVGWLAVVLAVVAHQLLFNVRRLLAATAHGLILADITFRRAEVVASWQRGTNATLTLRTDNPRVAVALEPAIDATGIGPPWNGRVSGTDLAAIETTIRHAGGEPLRLTAKD